MKDMTGRSDRTRAWPFDLRVVALVALAGLIGMAVLFSVVVNQFRLVQLRDARDIGSAYIQGFLAPYAAEGVENGAISSASQAVLLEVVRQFPDEHGFVSVKIWTDPTTLLFISDPDKDASGHDQDELALAFRGQIVVELEEPVAVDGTPIAPHLEIYAPVYAPGTQRLIAVGEIYQSAAKLLAERDQFALRMLSAFAIAASGFLGLMYLIARQQRALIQSLAEEARSAAQNRQLATAVQAASQEASLAHESLLNKLGAELHDGPVQLLSLLALAPPETAPAAGSAFAPATIARDVLADLRRISVGLSLPELGNLTVSEIISLAVQRHRSATQTDVALEQGTLPDRLDDQRGICIYRIVQEGLNNAFRHTGGKDQVVMAKAQGGILTLAVRNAFRPDTTRPDLRADALTGLGQQGLRNRLRAFGGTLDVQILPDQTFVMTAHLPLN